MKLHSKHPSSKTSIVGYALAVMLALQPLLNVEVNLANSYERLKYALRLLFAAGVALLGKYMSNHAQVKNGQHMEEANDVTNSKA